MEINMSRRDEEEIEQILATVDNTTFDMSDWNVVITECSSLAAEWELLSAYLGISAKMIDIIKRDNPNKSSACWNEALKQWIMQSYETEKFDNPSWRTLLKAIAKLDKLLFKKLAGKYQSQPKPNKSEKDGESGTQRSRISDSKQAADEPANIAYSVPSKSHRFTFPLLNLKKMSEDEKELLHQRLFAESERMERNFQALFKATRMSLVERKVTVGDLLKHLDCLGSIKPLYKGSDLPVFGCQLPRLRETENVDNAMSVISSYCSFFNYHILEEIIINLGTEQDKASLEKYKEEFGMYAQRHVFECPSEVGEITEEGHANMFVTLDIVYDSYTVSHLYAFVSNLQRVLKIPAVSLRLCRIGPGSLRLMFQLPYSVQQVTFPLSSDQEAELTSLGVIQLSCGNYQFTTQKPLIMKVGDSSDKEYLDDTDSEQSGDAESIQVMGLVSKKGDTFSVPDSALGRSSYSTSTTGMTLFSEDMYILDRGLGDIFSSKDGDSNTGNKLVDASANGNLQEVKRLTEEEQLDPEQGVGKNEVNALHEAAVTGHLDVLRYFIEERGCNAACMSVGGTPLHYAAMKNHLHIVQYLIEMQQVEPFIRSHNDGSTALQCACYGGSIDVIHYLAKEMSKYLPLKDIVEDRDRKGYRPLHETALFGHLEATKFLITELNADPNGTNDSGVLPLHFAVYGGHLEVVKYLIEHHQKHCDPSCRLNKDPRGWHGRLLLETAHKCGHHHIVEYLESVID